MGSWILTAMSVALLLATSLTASTQSPAVSCPVPGPALIPHQFECSCFFQCNRNDTIPALLLRCPNKLHYSETSPARCEDPEEVLCTPLITTRLTASTDPPACPSDQSALDYVYLVSNPRNCSQFYRCHQGEAQLFECPSYWYFDPVFEVCTPAKEPSCPPTNDEKILLPHPTQCNAFYICDWGNPVLFYCPSTLFFSNKTKECDFPQNVDCNRCHL
ncbi:peritrophin-1-like [Cryptotermes secundus]|uniref:peritrophin-1-like n=1 Tax=Cryptotermes secundus TaxID=105785 RepID=UPI001454BBF0|nr:peritrophin-1-like [Cryptotermes secundus]